MVFVLALALAGCGSATPAASPSTPKPASKPASTSSASRTASVKPTPTALKHVKLQLAWLISGFHAPLILAKTRGYYRQAGLDVKIVPGHGGNLAVNQVAKGGPVFSALSISSAILPISKGVPVKAIAVYDHVAPLALIYHAGHPLQTPKDLAGRTILYQASAVSWQLFPALLATHGLTMKQMHLTLHNAESQEFPALYANDPNVVAIGYDNSDYLRIRAANPDARYRLYSTWGVNLYDMGLITNDQMIKQHPNEVRAFVAATTKGWLAAKADPQAAVAATVKMYPQVNPKVISTGLKLTLQQIAAPKGHPIDWMSPSAWKKQLSLLRKYAHMKRGQPASDFYTNRFVTG